MEGLLPIIIERMSMLWGVFIHEPKVYFPLIGEWYLIILYFILSKDKEGIADVYAAGVTLLFIGFELMPFHDIRFDDATFYLSVGLMIWGAFLVLIAATKLVPNPVARVLGCPTATALPALLIILRIETQVPIDLLTLGVVASPALVLEIIKYGFQFSRSD